MRLARASDTHLKQLQGWFTDASATLTWGGPDFRYPFDDRSFREDTGFEQLDSYVLLDEPGSDAPGVPDAGAMLGFGQVYMRVGRIHFGRLAIAPALRGRGLGKQLTRRLMETGESLFGPGEFSLFVLEGNDAAIGCYRACGFEFAAYPEAMDWPLAVLYMVCRGRPAPGPT